MWYFLLYVDLEIFNPILVIESEIGAPYRVLEDLQVWKVTVAGQGGGVSKDTEGCQGHPELLGFL